MVKKNVIQTAVSKVAQTRTGAAVFAKSMHHLDRPLLRWTNGRFSLSSIFTGLPIINLTTIGRKSGQPRTVPLVGIPDGDNLILIASNFGGRKNPAWYYNLTANPKATVVINGRSSPYVAHQAHGKERDTAWKHATALYGGYKNYERWANHRDIPVMVLERMKGDI